MEEKEKKQRFCHKNHHVRIRSKSQVLIHYNFELIKINIINNNKFINYE